MRTSVKIASLLVAATLLLASCRELPRYFSGDDTLARAAGRELRLRDVAGVIPQGVTGADSIAFLQRYVDRWVRKQLKLQEAEVLFSSSEGDIDRMVEEYRQALLIRKVDRYYVDRQIDTLFTDAEIESYYEAHKSDFRSDRTLVRGRIVRLPEGFRLRLRLRELMGSSDEARQRDFSDLCAKNDFSLTDFGGRWVDYQEFLSYLPTLRSQNYDSALRTGVVQEMRDSRSYYYFQIGEVRREGEPIPLEMLRPTIRRVLFNHRQGEIVRRHEEELYREAESAGKIRSFVGNAAAGESENETER